MWDLLTFSVELYLVIMMSLMLVSVLLSRHLSSERRREQSAGICASLALCCILSLMLYSEGELHFLLYYYEPSVSPFFYSNRDFVSNPFLFFCKVFSLILCAACLCFSALALSRQPTPRVEHGFFLVTGILGALLMISSNNLFYIYLSLELINFSVYLILGGSVHSTLSNEAALRYFVFSSYASALFLLGVCLIYGVCGTVNLGELSPLLSALPHPGAPPLLALALLFLCSALFFKLGLFPFHFWVSDIYEGSSYSSALFLATVPKIALYSLLIKIYFLLCLPVYPFFFPNLLCFLCIGSIVYGTIASLYAFSLKRFLALSGISHWGFIILGLSLGTLAGIQSSLSYLFIYMIMTLGLFGLIQSSSVHSNLGKIFLRTEAVELREIFSLKYLSNSTSFRGSLTVLLLSMAGVPPLAGFFVKFLVVAACVETQRFFLAGLVFLFSMVGAVAYLRLLRIIYASPLLLSFSQKPLRSLYHSVRSRSWEVSGILSLVVLVLLLFGFLLWPLLNTFFAFLAQIILGLFR